MKASRFLTILLSFVMLLACLDSLSYSQDGKNKSPRYKFLQATALYGLLSNASVQKELEFSKAQSNRLKTTLKSRFDEIKKYHIPEIIRRRQSNLEPSEGLQEAETLAVDSMETFLESLVDTQKERLVQIQMQQRAMRQDFLLPIASSTAIKALDLPVEQKERFFKESNELKSKIKKRLEKAQSAIEKLMHEHELNVRSVLNAEQRKMLGVAFGDPIPNELAPPIPDSLKLKTAKLLKSLSNN